MKRKAKRVGTLDWAAECIRRKGKGKNLDNGIRKPGNPKGWNGE